MNPSEPKLIETSPPYGVTLGMAWSFLWRSFLWSILVYVVLLILTIVLLFVTGAMGGMEDLAKGPPPVFVLLLWLLGLGAWFWVCQHVLRRLLGKTFGGYRLVLLTPQAGAPQAPPRASPSSHPDSV